MYDTYIFFNINKDKARCLPAPVMNKTPTESFLTYSKSIKIADISLNIRNSSLLYPIARYSIIQIIVKIDGKEIE